MIKVAKKIEGMRPNTGHINTRMNLSQSSNKASSLNKDSRKLRNNRNIKSAIPSGIPKPAIRKKLQNCEKFKSGKFSKFLDYLIEIKNDMHNASIDDFTPFLHHNNDEQDLQGKTREGNMSAMRKGGKKPTQRQISEYYILTIAKEAETYFKLDEIRK